MCMGVLSVCMYVCVLCVLCPKDRIGLQIPSQHVGAENRTWVLCKTNKCS